jgi:quercetin dioxygenase-like cupin family protein
MLESPPMNHRWLLFPVLAFAILAAAQAPAPVIEITAEPNHHLLFENQYVRVFKVDLAPHAAMLVHHHRHDYFFVALAPSSIENDIVGQAPVQHKFQEGETVFVPGNFAHFAKNLSDRPLQVIAVELMKNDPAQLAHKWDEDRALHVLNGGTLDILFVKDGVRAADAQLNPGGVVPRHHHNGPHVVIAITDLNLRTDIEGGGSRTVQLKAGEAAWANGNVTHTVTNVGSQNARLVTLEFP